MEFMKMVLDTTKNLLRNKSIQEILKYIAIITLRYAGTRFGVDQYKYEPLDMKNMIYNHNLNNFNKIDPRNIDQIIHLLSINRFIDELNKASQNKISMDTLVSELSKLCRDDSIISLYDDIVNNKNITLFDQETLETSSIADNYEISSGGIYIPNRSVNVVTNEGTMLADAKNEYLEKRAELGSNPTSEDLLKILKEYYDKIKYDETIHYFNR